MEIPATGGWYLVTRKICNSYAGLKDIEVKMGASPRCIFITNELETGDLYICQGSHHFRFYPSEEKQKHADIMKLKLVTLHLYAFC